MSRLISLTEYAKKHGRNPVTVRQKAQRGMLHTAVKIGKTWMVQEDEPFIDYRIKSGKYSKNKDAGFPIYIEETQEIKELKIILTPDNEEIHYSGSFNENDMERAQKALLREIKKESV